MCEGKIVLRKDPAFCSAERQDDMVFIMEVTVRVTRYCNGTVPSDSRAGLLSLCSMTIFIRRAGLLYFNSMVR